MQLRVKSRRIEETDMIRAPEKTNLLCRLIDSNQIFQGPKSFFTQATDNDQMLRPAEWAVGLTMLNDPLGECLADSRKHLELFSPRRVDIGSPG